MNPPANPAPRERRTRAAKRWRTFLLWFTVLAITPYGVVLFQSRTPARVPVIELTGLDPVVAREIQSALTEVRASPRSGAAWGRLGATLIHYEFPAETQLAFTEAERLDPRNPRWPHLHGLALSTTDIVSATELFRRAMELTGASPDAPRLHLALALAERAHITEAGDQFQTLLRQTPNHPVAALGLARLQVAAGRFAEATNLLHQTPGSVHTRRATHTLLATAEKALGNPISAAAAARTAATLPADTPWPDPWWTEALAHRVGRKALLEGVSTLLDRGDPAGALELLRRAPGSDSADTEARYLAGWALNQLGRFDEAEGELRLHVNLAPDSVKGRAQLAVALLSQKRPADALPVLEAAVALKPTWRELRSNLGFALVQLGRNADALTQYREALALDPNFLPTYFALAELLSRSGNRDESLQILRDAAALAPDDPQVRATRQRLESAPPTTGRGTAR